MAAKKPDVPTTPSLDFEKPIVADRPLTSDYVQLMLDDFVELHGDRVFGDDRAIVTGLATMAGVNFLLVGHRKGKTVKDRLACNFGCAHPEGYRKALQKMRSPRSGSCRSSRSSTRRGRIRASAPRSVARRRRSRATSSRCSTCACR
jgi:hypothetical protein